jgi:hypothetical protein
MTERNKIILAYLLLLLFTVAHMFEEAWGGFWISKVLGLGWFLAGNWLLLCIPFTFLYFILLEKRWAYYASVLYGAFMTLNGAGHIILTLVTGRYFDYAAGAVSGIALIIVGPVLTYLLVKRIRNRD